MRSLIQNMLLAISGKGFMIALLVLRSKSWMSQKLNGSDWLRSVSRKPASPECPMASISPLSIRAVTRRDSVSSQAQTLVEARGNSHCLMLDQRPSDPNVSVRFDHVWVIPLNLFNDSDMDPEVGAYWEILSPDRETEI